MSIPKARGMLFTENENVSKDELEQAATTEGTVKCDFSSVDVDKGNGENSDPLGFVSASR